MKNFLLGSLAILLSTSAFAVNHFDLRVVNADEATTFNSVDHPNGVFVLEAYFIDCPYCNFNAENVDELSEKYKKNADVHVLDVSVDCRESQYQNWLAKHNPNHPVLADCGGQSLIRGLGVTSFPTVIVVDCNMNEVFRTGGVWNDEKKTKIHTAIDAAVASCAKPAVEK
ncbi:redoxin family protein [Oligoflexaceae bacterium]|nr:redoxin family protein [Oligoflexaceae bacterium]